MFLWMMLCFCTHVTPCHLQGPQSNATAAEYTASIFHAVLLVFLQPFTFTPSAVTGLIFSVTISVFYLWETISSSTCMSSSTRFLLQVQYKKKCNLQLSYFSHFYMLIVLCKFKSRVDNKPETCKNRNNHYSYIRWLFKETEINHLLLVEERESVSPQVEIQYIPQQYGFSLGFITKSDG